MFPMLAFLWQLTFTAPATDATAPGSCPVGCVGDTASSPVPLRDLKAFEVWWHRQSPTWVTWHAAMQADASVWTARWPTVVSEATWRRYASYPATSAQAGMPVAIAMPDSLPLGREYAVVSIDSTGNRSCLSNPVIH